MCLRRERLVARRFASDLASCAPRIKTNALNSAAASDAERYERRAAVVTIVTPFAAVFLAIWYFWGNGISGLDLALMAFMYTVTGLGITVGFHRLFTHRSFECVTPVRVALAVAGSMSAQGPILFWTACHRRHHQCSDDVGDPHSPHNHGPGIAGVLMGCWHSHVGWMFNHKPENYIRRVPDLIRDRRLMAINRWYPAIVIGGLLLPGVIALAITGRWAAFGSAVLWAGFVRLFLGHHTTWSINSVCHLFGGSPYETGDRSRNNGVCALLTFGEGWHNNHHAFPTSARHGLRWWQLDGSFILIRTLALVGLVWNVRLPSPEQLEARSFRPQLDAEVVAANPPVDDVVPPSVRPTSPA